MPMSHGLARTLVPPDPAARFQEYVFEGRSARASSVIESPFARPRQRVTRGVGSRVKDFLMAYKRLTWRSGVRT